MRRAFAAACLLWSACASGQATLIEDYARVTALANYMSTFVGETLLACAEIKVLTEEQAEARFAAYRKRNAALFERVERWSEEAERRLGERGEGREARQRSEDAGLTAMAAASGRAYGDVRAARDPAAFCAARFAAIQDGAFDATRNAELAKLLARRE
ncbi:MAG: hypothetical protein ACT4P4_10040 [Betaproteobacteria bacterium]